MLFMSAKPYLSVCIPAYNKSDRLRKNLASLLNACGDDIEIVVVDNVSEENLEEVCKNFNDPRISYYRNEELIVAQANWIRSVRLAKGQWALLMMDRDFINGKGIPALIEELKKHKTFGTGNLLIHFGGGKEEIYFKDSKIENVEEFPAGEIGTLLESNRVGHPSGNLYNRDFLTVSEGLETAIIRRPRLNENIYLMYDQAWKHGFLKIHGDMIYSVPGSYLKTYKSGYKASYTNTKSVNYYPYFTPEGFMTYIREDLEEMLKLDFPRKIDSKELCVQAYNGYIKDTFLSMISIPRSSPLWRHYDEKYTYRTGKERKRIATEFCEDYKATVRRLLGDDAEDVLPEIEPIQIDWLTYIKPTLAEFKYAIADIPVIGPFLLQVKHWLIRS